jgi:hypothetical protein
MKYILLFFLTIAYFINHCKHIHTKQRLNLLKNLKNTTFHVKLTFFRFF